MDHNSTYRPIERSEEDLTFVQGSYGSARTVQPYSTVLIVDDNPDIIYAIEGALTHAGIDTISASSPEEGMQKAAEVLPAVILCDVVMPGMDGYEFTRRIKNHQELRTATVVLVTGKDEEQDVIYGLDQGADDYITKPFRSEELVARVRAALRLQATYRELQEARNQNALLRQKLSGEANLDMIVGASSQIESVRRLVQQVAQDNIPVLITGATGTGKELVARSLHFQSDRRERPFIAKNCAAFTDSLIESELFGHARGAFTGAHRDQLGLFAAADGGTLFLDEIGELKDSLQAKLLRVLQNGCFTPVGSNRERKVDVRIIAATNRDLREMIQEGSFRADLYYRLNVITIPLPTLAERRSDIPILCQHFLSRYAAERGEAKRELSPETLEYLVQHEWSGNVRELENELERLLVLGRGNPILEDNLLSPYVRQQPSHGHLTSSNLKEAVCSLERKLILETLELFHWNKTDTARELGISRSNLIAKVQQFGLYKPKN